MAATAAVSASYTTPRGTTDLRRTPVRTLPRHGSTSSRRGASSKPGRFKRAHDVGPYLGLTPTRHQSGEVDRHGRISKCGAAFTRTCLYEAVNVLLTKVQRFSPLMAWGTRLVQRVGAKKAHVAIARKIAVILRCLWVDGTEFWWTREEARMA